MYWANRHESRLVTLPCSDPAGDMVRSSPLTNSSRMPRCGIENNSSAVRSFVVTLIGITLRDLDHEYWAAGLYHIQSGPNHRLARKGDPTTSTFAFEPIARFSHSLNPARLRRSSSILPRSVLMQRSTLRPLTNMLGPHARRRISSRASARPARRVNKSSTANSFGVSSSAGPLS